MRRLLTVLAIAVLGLTLVQAPAYAADLVYKIINDRSDRCLDQDYTGGSPHATVQVWNCINPGDNQKWKLHAVGGSSDYQLINVRSHQCLDQDYSGGTVHLKVTAHACNDGLNQMFKVVWDSVAVTARIEVPLSPDAYPYCLDQDYSGGMQHSTLLVYRCNGGSNQTWVMVDA